MKRGKGKSSLGALFLFVAIIGAVLYVYTSEMFERNPPVISMDTNGYWNLKKPLKISISDDGSLKSYRITLKSHNDETELEHEQFMVVNKSINIEVKPPKSAYAMKDNNIKIFVEATDASKWNFLNGNRSVLEFKLKIDKRRPELNIVSNSYKIQKGGSALVIFKAKDDNLKNIFIQTNFGKKFQAQPFYKDGYYVSLIAWPVTEKKFKATIHAQDYANNESKAYIPLYLKDRNYRVSNIKLSDRFLKGKISELADEFSETGGILEPIEQFKIINEDVRAKNEKLIHEITSNVSDELIDNFKINKMYPLKNAQIVASFGDHRKYSYNGEAISESYHLGLDMASNAMANIKPQNGGNVVYSNYNGIYGNMPVISHGLGLYTLYGHCSSVNVNNGEYFSAKNVVAKTGKSGYAMGDHLHFGVLVQGIEVRPQEWMDEKWMQLNITNIIKEAKNIISGDK